MQCRRLPRKRRNAKAAPINVSHQPPLRIGDQLTIGLLGVERTARISSLRRIDWDSLGFNYVLVFSPNAIADAPHNLAAMIDLPKGTERGGMLRTLVKTIEKLKGEKATTNFLRLWEA